MILGCALVVSITTPKASADSAAAPLRYVFAPTITNAYRIDIESQGDSGREAVTGVFLVSARSAGGSYTTLTLNGRFQPKPGLGMIPMYRPGSAVPLSALLSGMTMGPRELTIDELGRWARAAGDLPLPIPLGTVMTALFPELPEQSNDTWTNSQKVVVMDDPACLGPSPVFSSQPPYSYGYNPGRSAQGALCAVQSVRWELKESTDAGATFRRSLTLNSGLALGSEPRISATGEGQVVFDRKAGVARLIELETKTTALSEHLSRRTLLTFRAELLQGAAREQALNPPPPPKPPEQKIRSAAELNDLIGKLKSEDAPARQSAAFELTQGTFTNVTPQMVESVASLAGDPDEHVRRAALTLLANYGNEAHVPQLIVGLQENDSVIRATLIRGLSKSRSPKAAAALAEVLATGGTEPFRSGRMTDVIDALTRMGPMAEAAALPLLKQKRAETLVDACAVLRQVGTRKSLPELKDLTGHRQKEVSEAAAEACRAIQSREDR